MGKYIFNNSLKGKHKAFDKRLFNLYDRPARDKIKKVLKDFVIDNPNQYEQDLIITDPNYKYKFIELQVCTSWIGENYPFDNVFIYERKYHHNNDTIFITLNKNMTKYLVV